MQVATPAVYTILLANKYQNNPFGLLPEDIIYKIIKEVKKYQPDIREYIRILSLSYNSITVLHHHNINKKINALLYHIEGPTVGLSIPVLRNTNSYSHNLVKKDILKDNKRSSKEVERMFNNIVNGWKFSPCDYSPITKYRILLNKRYGKTHCI